MHVALVPGCRGWQPWLLATYRPREERGRVAIITTPGTGALPVTLHIRCLSPLCSSSKGLPKATLSSIGDLFSRLSIFPLWLPGAVPPLFAAVVQAPCGSAPRGRSVGRLDRAEEGAEEGGRSLPGLPESGERGKET